MRPDPGSRDRVDFRQVVEGDDQDLVIVAAESQGGLMAVDGLAAHLHAADRAERLGLNQANDFGSPATVADANVLDDSHAGPRGIFRLRRAGRNHVNNLDLKGGVGGHLSGASAAAQGSTAQATEIQAVTGFEAGAGLAAAGLGVVAARAFCSLWSFFFCTLPRSTTSS